MRFAPAVWKDRVYAASDDGYLYCLAAKDGSLINKWRGGPVRRDDPRQRPYGFALGRPVEPRPFEIASSISPPASGRRMASICWRSTPNRAACCGATTRRARSSCPPPHGGANAESGVSAGLSGGDFRQAAGADGPRSAGRFRPRRRQVSLLSFAGQRPHWRHTNDRRRSDFYNGGSAFTRPPARPRPSWASAATRQCPARGSCHKS